MRLSHFDYDLPKELIAQQPSEVRDESKLMVLDRKEGSIEHKVFKEVIDLLKKGDVLVLNDTKVIPARLRGKEEGSGRRIEVLLLRQRGDSQWDTLVKPGRRIKEGSILSFGELKGEATQKVEGSKWRIQFRFNGEFRKILDGVGEVPLPPYIKRPLLKTMDMDKERYQTVYAKEEASVAAPTAGLHFTEELLKNIEDKGVIVTFLTLHLGYGSFKPIREEIKDHTMEDEYFELGDDLCQVVNGRKGRLIAVGTSTCRALESCCGKDGRLSSQRGWTNLFIHPPYKFKLIDSLITNLHLPKSTHLLLVSAFAGRDLLMEAYKEAIGKGYHFYSYGDAMLVL